MYDQRPFCYIAKGSDCSDATSSSYVFGEKMSAEACLNFGNSEHLEKIKLHMHVIFSIVIVVLLLSD